MAFRIQPGRQPGAQEVLDPDVHDVDKVKKDADTLDIMPHPDGEEDYDGEDEAGDSEDGENDDE